MPDTDRLIIDALSTAVLLLDAELVVIDLNPAAEALLDVSRKQALGTSAANLLGPACAAGGVIERARAGHATLTEHELQLRLPGERSVLIDCSVTPVLDTGVERHLLVELHGVGRQSRISSEERLLSQNESARALVRGLAHEIRNPLGGLRGAAQLLARELHDEELREYTAVIIGEADRLQKLLDRMLGPRRPPAMRDINVHEITERLRALLAAEHAGQVSVRRDYDPSLPTVHIDPELLMQALLNIARNAVEAGARVITLQTRIARNTSVGARRCRMAVRIDLHDDGAGVPDALRDTVFYPMVTGRANGTGLGLSIAQSVIAQQGGLVEFTSTPGATVFSILLPVEERA